MIYSGFDFKNPDYPAIFEQRAEFLTALRGTPDGFSKLRAHYKNAPWDMVNDWGMTFDPRALTAGGLANLPFVLWPRQKDFLQWLTERYLAGENGLVEKSRDCGVTWLTVGWSACMWCNWAGFSAGFGSRKEEIVDKIGNPDCIFEKLRHFIKFLPTELLPQGFESDRDARHMGLYSPHTGASITGEAGDNIGRGGRKSIYIVDEAAFIEHQDLVNKALSATTNCQIDVSTVNGNGNAFYRKRMRFDNTPRIFIFDWRDDPRKDDDWLKKRKLEMTEAEVASEILRDYNASQEDSFIPAKYVAASIDAHKRLGFDGAGIRVTAFDPADTGDAKAVLSRHGSVIVQAKAITTGDITTALPEAYAIADKMRADAFVFDADGMGTVAIKLGADRLNAGRMHVSPYRGSGKVKNPLTTFADSQTNRKTNKEALENYRAQSWLMLHDRFERTYNAIQQLEAGHIIRANPDELISISTDCEHWQQLQAELSRPKRIFSANGKIAVESKKSMKSRGVDSPNLADALVMANQQTVGGFYRSQDDSQNYTLIEHQPIDDALGF